MTLKTFPLHTAIRLISLAIVIALPLAIFARPVAAQYRANGYVKCEGTAGYSGAFGYGYGYTTHAYTTSCPLPNAFSPSTPVQYDLADSTGQHWRHADAEYLASWVAGRNKGLVGGVVLSSAKPNVNAKATPNVLQPNGPISPPTILPPSDPYNYGPTLNSARASIGLPALTYDPALARDAAINSSQGYGHFYLGSARRQNVGSGDLSTVHAMWVADPPHAAALFDGSCRYYGIACVNGVWTFDAR